MGKDRYQHLGDESSKEALTMVMMMIIIMIIIIIIAVKKGDAVAQ